MWVEGSTGCPTEAKRRTWSREEVARLLVECDASRSTGQSQRAFAREHGIPEGTLRHWLARRAGLDADAQLVAFFESPAGLAFLHRLVLAAVFQFNQIGSCGVDQVAAFLKMVGVDAFVATSHGTLSGVAAAMERQIVAFGQDQGRISTLGEAATPGPVCSSNAWERGRPRPHRAPRSGRGRPRSQVSGATSCVRSPKIEMRPGPAPAVGRRHACQAHRRVRGRDSPITMPPVLWGIDPPLCRWGALSVVSVQPAGWWHSHHGPSEP